MMIKINKKSGFTLIELMIVIAIVGILAVVIMPTLNQQLTEIPDQEKLTFENLFHVPRCDIKTLVYNDKEEEYYIKAEFLNGVERKYLLDRQTISHLLNNDIDELPLIKSNE